MTRIAFVTPVEVDHPVDGLRWRAHLTERGLRAVGSVEVIEVTTDHGRRGDGVVVTPRTAFRRAISRIHPAQPARVAARDWRPAGRRLRGMGSYDLVWVMQPDLVAAGVALPPGPLVVDMVDLEDGKYQRRGLADRHQRRRWAAAQRHVVDRADAVVAANPDEVASLDHARARLLANAVDVAPVVSRQDPARLMLVGRFTYQPNLEAARWFVDSVLPHLRDAVPAVTVALVGRHDGALGDLDGRPGVEVCGFVSELDEEWARATAMVAPVRTGTGTRIKIIEAFARGVPVVSTTRGCDGLAVADDRELLIADDPVDFAAACGSLLADPSRRERLTRAAADLVAREHSPAVFEATVAQVAEEVLTAGGQP